MPVYQRLILPSLSEPIIIWHFMALKRYLKVAVIGSKITVSVSVSKNDFVY